MTGPEIRRIREALGLDLRTFAKFLCVHQSTLYYWEQKQDPPLKGYTPAILAKLVAVKPTKKLGDLLRRAVVAHGGLAGLSVLLKTKS